MVKSLHAMWETRVQSLGQEDPLDKEMAIPSVFLTGKFHGQRSVEVLQSMGLQRAGYECVTGHDIFAQLLN